MHDRDHEAINGKSAAKIDWFIWKWNTLFERFRFVGFTAHRWRVLKITPVIHEIDKKGSLVPDEQLGQLLAWVVRATIVRLSKIIVRLAASVTFFGFFFIAQCKSFSAYDRTRNDAGILRRVLWTTVHIRARDDDLTGS